MTVHEPICPGQELALPPDAKNLAEQRDLAIERWLFTYDTFHANRQAAQGVCVAAQVDLLGGSASHGEDRDLGQLFYAGGEVEVWEGEGYERKRVKRSARDRFEKALAVAIDRRSWRSLMESTGFERLLDKQARNEFENSLKGEPPRFDAETIIATFGHIWENRRELWLRGIAKAFAGLDRRFRSHDPFGLGHRVVFDYAMNDFGHSMSHDKELTIYDVERVFRELDGRGPAGWAEGTIADIKRLCDGFSWDVKAHGRVENEYFKIDVFKNRNVHLWFTNKELVAQVNKLILEYYKPVEGDVDLSAAPWAKGPQYHATPAKHHGEFFSSEAVAEAVMGRAEISGREYVGRSESNPSGFEDRVPRVLEPSAGNGVLAKAARAKGARVTCVEVQTHWAFVLKEAGFDSTLGDFLKLQPADLGGQFDYIVMNPPFDRGRDCDHVRHAYEFLKPGGTLIAVMAARAEFAEDARHKALHTLIERSGGERYETWRDLPERSFAHAGTNVNTVTLKITKRLG